MNRREIVEELIEKGYQAEVHDVIKNGVTFEGIMIRGEGAVAPIIYTNEVIKVAEANGASLSEVVDEVIREYKAIYLSPYWSFSPLGDVFSAL